ncbi:hypothetical protein GAY30_33665, partial [Azospirillum brasilense]|nr:hypothetical protein [Azospirillum brasilense]
MPDSSRLAPLPVGPTGAPPRLGLRHLLAPALLTLGAAGLAGQRPWLSGLIAPIAGVMAADALAALLAAAAWLGAAWLGSRVIDLV